MRTSEVGLSSSMAALLAPTASEIGVSPGVTSPAKRGGELAFHRGQQSRLRAGCRAILWVLWVVSLTTSEIRSATTGDPAWESDLRRRLEIMAAHLTATLTPWPVPELVVRVEDHGALGDGRTLNTAALQRAIDHCSSAGGGTVLLSQGDYVTGTLDLRTGVMLEITAHARLLGSTNLADYPDRIASRPTVMDSNMGANKSLLFAEGVERIGLRGPGCIDFRGSQEHFPGKQTVSATPGRPFGIRVIDSRKIVIENITLKNAACWMQNYLNCEDLLFQRMTVFNHANHNNDGLDIDGCRRVIVSDCLINSEDDALCLKGASLRPTEDVLIENCTFVTTCNALKIGTDTQGDFRRIHARRLTLGGIPLELPSSKGHQASSGITLATVDGGVVEEILVSDVTINRTRAPLFLRVGNRGRVMPGAPRPPIGTLHRVIISNVTGNSNLRQGSFIGGIKEGRIEDIAIRNVSLSVEGGGTEEMSQSAVPEDERGYPDAHQFNVKGLPAHGFYVRHASRIHFSNILISTETPDRRPCFAHGGGADDVSVDRQPAFLP